MTQTFVLTVKLLVTNLLHLLPSKQSLHLIGKYVAESSWTSLCLRVF